MYLGESMIKFLLTFIVVICIMAESVVFAEEVMEIDPALTESITDTQDESERDVKEKAIYEEYIHEDSQGNIPNITGDTRQYHHNVPTHSPVNLTPASPSSPIN